MEKMTDKEIKERMLLIKEIPLANDDILNIKEHQGGLVNYIFKVETKKGDFYLKQFLPELKSDFFKGLELGPKDRIKLSYDVTNIYERILQRSSNIIPHIYLYNEMEGYMIMEGFKGVHTAIEDIKSGKFSNSLMTSLSKAIALVHQETFSNNNNETGLYNKEWLKLKLKYQYYEMAKIIQTDLGNKLTVFTDNYSNTKKALVHGDLCSINILTDDSQKLHLIDFEDAHIGTPAFDIGYLFSEFFVARLNFNEQRKEISEILSSFLNEYFSIFNKVDRLGVEKEITMHTASLILYRVFGLSKDAFTSYIKDEVKDSAKQLAEDMIKNSDLPISNYI